MNKKITAGILSAVVMASAFFSPVSVLADSVEGKTYLSLGADLTESEKSTVLDLLGVNPDELYNYEVYEVTNEQEHEYLDTYLDASLIGDRAQSSVKVTGKEDGYGIQVVTYNISYCTVGMYQNALATAGIENAEVVVAGPYSMSGTAALVGAIEAYSRMTGEVIQPELADGATNELVVTSDVAKSIGSSEKAEELIAAVKEIVIANEYKDAEQIDRVIDDVANQLQIILSDRDRQMIRELMQKLEGLDLNLDRIKEQASTLYARISDLDLSEYGITQENVDGILSAIKRFFVGLYEVIMGLFNK